MKDDTLSEPILVANSTSLADLKAAGWGTNMSSSGVWWWEKWEEIDGRKQRVALKHVPFWVREMVFEAHKNGAANARKDIRRAMGLKVKEE